jgi:hypothetical protein
MTSWTRTAAIVLAVGAVLLTGGPAQAQSGWTTVASPTQPGRNFLYGADASDAGHVWAVGYLAARVTSTPSSLILRYDGVAWRPAPLSGFPANSALSNVDAVSATEAWAAGRTSSVFGRSSTLVARWNGSSWAPEVTPNGNPSGTNGLSGIAAAGGTVWAVGTYIEPGSSSYNRRSLILQRTGGTWRISPVPRVQGNEFLLGVDATTSTDAWAVGWGSPDISIGPAVPLVLRWNGTGWRSQTLPATASTTLTAVDALTPSNVWVAGRTLVGGYQTQPYVAQFNGTSWRRIATPAVEGQLTDIVALSTSDIIAVGTTAGGPLVLHWNGSSWTREATPNPGTVTGAAAVGPSTYWAVGYRFDLAASYEERTFTMVRS